MDDDDRQLLREMIGYIDDIIADSQGEGSFVNDKDRYRLCVFGLFLVGEKAGKLSKQLRDANADINWVEIRGLRNNIAHKYAKLTRALILDSVERDVPILKEQLERILRENL